MPREARRRYARWGGGVLLLCLLPSPAPGQHPNVLVGDYFSERPNYPNEPSIVINPRNTKEMMATTNGPKESYYYSTDGGASWRQGGTFSFATGLWGDPCVITNTSGNYYFLHLERNWTALAEPDLLVDLSEESDGVQPLAFAHISAYPNPFNAITSIQYLIPSAGVVSLGVFDLTGKMVALLSSGPEEAGTHRVLWDAGDLASGEYLVRLEYGKRSRTLRIVLLK